MYGKNIRYLRRRRGLKQDDLAELLGLKSYTAIQHWETEHSQPNLGQLKILADYFGYSMSDIANTDLEMVAAGAEVEVVKRLPVLGDVAAGSPIYAVENIVDYIEFKNHGDFALKIKGDSMEPRICDGDIVIVAKDDEIKNGDIVIVVINGDEAVCKKIKFQQDGILLLSFNENYDPLFFTEKQINDLPVTVIGRVVEVRTRY